MVDAMVSLTMVSSAWTREGDRRHNGVGVQEDIVHRVGTSGQYKACFVLGEKCRGTQSLFDARELHGRCCGAERVPVWRWY
jgi:hypothetical protein